jgi:hypothetical protein
MSINKKCDSCGKVLMDNNSVDFEFSPWRLYHFKKIRDFCSNECFINWIVVYFKDIKVNKTSEDLLNTILIMIKNFKNMENKNE